MKPTILVLVIALTFPLPSRAQMAFNLQPQPCRVADTRSITGMVAGSTIFLKARGGSAWIGQGGASGCGTATTAKAIVATLTIIGPDRAGQLLAWAYGTPTNQIPTNTVTLYASGPGTTVSSLVVLPLCTSGAFCTYDVAIFTLPAAQGITLDLIGYFE